MHQSAPSTGGEASSFEYFEFQHEELCASISIRLTGGGYVNIFFILTPVSELQSYSKLYNSINIVYIRM